MGVINVYAGGTKRQLQEVGRLLDRANQALQTLERYKLRLDDAISNLTALEIEDVVTVRDVVSVVQRGEMVHRIADEIETMIVELGVDARLLRLQLDETYSEFDDQLDDVIADYLPPHRNVDDTLAELARLRDDDVLDARTTLSVLHLGAVQLDDEVAPKGLRLLHRVHKLPPELASRIANEFGGLARLQRVTIQELMNVEGVDEGIAESVKDTLERVTENTILDQYS
jgi:diadenylate cyclase